MSQTLHPAPVRKSLVIRATPEKAFEVFTTGFGRWWPKSHSTASSPQKQAVIEPRAGGRWYEQAEDGAECEWGEVLAWRLNSEFKYDPDLLTEVDVRFTPLADGHTRLDFEHRGLERMGALAAETRVRLDSPGGWGGLLDGYRLVAEA